MIKKNDKYIISFICGSILALGFQPTNLIFTIFTFSILFFQIYIAKNAKEAFFVGYFFGLGFYIFLLYWLAIAVSIYEEFLWAIPFALLGLQSFIAIFVAITCYMAWFFRNSDFYVMIFCTIYCVQEWLISWIFTGLPWGMVGYIFSVSNIIAQLTSIFGILGLSFFVLYIGSVGFYLLKNDTVSFKIKTQIILLCSILIISFGYIRLIKNPTIFSDINVRIVQTSVKQEEKWNRTSFIQHLNEYIELSRKASEDIDIIIWPEAAVTLPYKHKDVHMAIKSLFNELAGEKILIFGGISVEQNNYSESFNLFSSMIGLDNNGDEMFLYHKAHLVPFGEYIPLRRWFLPIKKLTPGMIDYTQGKVKTVTIPKYNLTIRPLICYESIFPFEVMLPNEDIDLLINISNDSWYGNSSQPYQHLEISRVRAIENGTPLIRASSSGISATVDPFGRVLKQLKLNEKGVLDQLIPIKTHKNTIFSQFSLISFYFLLLVISLLEIIWTNLRNFQPRIVRNA